MNIGILALQGDFTEHITTLNELGAAGVEVRLPEQLSGLDGLIIPGGESTTMLKLIDAYGFTGPLTSAAAAGMPMMGTCAGLVLLSRELDGNTLRPLGLMDIKVRRNAFGRQVDSFETDIIMPVLGDEPYHAVFIRAPFVTETGDTAEPLARLEDGTVVAVRQGKMLAMAFHPELTGDRRLHRYFLDIIAGKK